MVGKSKENLMATIKELYDLCKKKKREESVIELHIIVNENMFFGLMLMNKVIMLVFTLKNLIVRTKSISIINECGVVNDLLFN